MSKKPPTPLKRMMLPLGANITLPRQARVRYDIYLFEHVVNPELYFYVTIHYAGKLIATPTFRMDLKPPMGVVPFINLNLGEVMRRRVREKHFVKAMVHGHIIQLLMDMCTEIRAAHKDCWPPVVHLDCVPRSNSPDVFDNIINRYEGSPREKAGIARLTATPTERTIERRARIPGNQGGWLTRNVKSDWTARERRILRFCNKLIKGVQD